jgi:multicomponent Na+:H+ antiporter subunit B
MGLFVVSGLGLAALLVWGLAGLPDVGDYKGPYGIVLDRVAVGQRHATNVVASVVFDYRGLDTLGEELILFSSVMGTALLLREVRNVEPERPRDRAPAVGVRALGILLAPLALLVGLAVVAHGPVTPGGGFQGGVVLAASFLLVYLAHEYRSYREVTPSEVVDLAEGASIAGFVAVGVVGIAAGGSFLENVLPLGIPGSLASSGTIELLNVLTAGAVAAAFVLLFTEFLEEALVVK